MEKTKLRGFTLIELLVVIAIIGILSTLAVVSLGNARTRARDSKRLADMRSIQSAVEIYYTDQQQYPDRSATTPCGAAALPQNIETCCLDNSTDATLRGWRATGSCTGGSTLITVPTDPVDASTYVFSRPDPNTYYVQFRSENDPDSGGPLVGGGTDLAPTFNCLSPTGMAAEGGDAGTDCP